MIKHGLYVVCIDKGILKELLKYSLPLVPHTVAYNIQTYATKVIINGKLSLALLGIYSLASQFGSIAGRNFILLFKQHFNHGSIEL